MNIEVLTEWIKRQGYRVVTTASSRWYEIRPHVYQAIPYYDLIAPSDVELHQLLRERRALALRYSTSTEAGEGKLSYHVINSNKDYDVTGLSSNSRYHVRRGLRYAGVEPISLARLASGGWVLRRETLARQGRLGAETAVWWARLCRSAEGLPGFEAWGAFHDGEMIASILSLTVDGCSMLLYQQSCARALKNNVNNALAYGLTKELLGRAAITRVFYGLHSLDADERLDTFKFRLGYVARPVRQRVVFNRWMKFVVNRAGHRILKAARCRWPQQPTIAKAEGMARFYLEGRKSLAEQIWPECLKGRQGALLSP